MDKLGYSSAVQLATRRKCCENRDNRVVADALVFESGRRVVAAAFDLEGGVFVCPSFLSRVRAKFFFCC